MDEKIERIVDLFSFEKKTAEEIIAIFKRILEKLFADRIFNRGRFLVVEKFVYCIVKRAAHIDPVLLLAALRYRIHQVCFNANID